MRLTPLLHALSVFFWAGAFTLQAAHVDARAARRLSVVFFAEESGLPLARLSALSLQPARTDFGGLSVSAPGVHLRGLALVLYPVPCSHGEWDNLRERLAKLPRSGDPMRLISPEGRTFTLAGPPRPVGDTLCADLIAPAGKPRPTLRLTRSDEGQIRLVVADVARASRPWASRRPAGSLPAMGGTPMPPQTTDLPPASLSTP